MTSRLVSLLVAPLVAGCVGSPGPDPAPDRAIASRETPRGTASIELVVEPEEIGLDDTVSIRLVNRGEVALTTGLPFGVERREGNRWVEVPWPENVAFPLIGIVLRPGGSTEPQEWPDFGIQVEPGLYRAAKSATYEDPEDEDFGLVARAEFRVRASG